MSCFQNSTHLDSVTLMNYSFSIDLNASLTQIGLYGTKFETPIGSFGDPSRLHFHNVTIGPFVRLQTLYVGETLYCMIGQLDKSTKNLSKCISVCPTQVSKPPLKQPTTQVLKFGIFWINYGMKGHSYEIMKAFIKSTKI
jgi:hypothetical protein